jgi:hypothetical protein
MLGRILKLHHSYYVIYSSGEQQKHTHTHLFASPYVLCTFYFKKKTNQKLLAFSATLFTLTNDFYYKVQLESEVHYRFGMKTVVLTNCKQLMAISKRMIGYLV